DRVKDVLNLVSDLGNAVESNASRVSLDRMSRPPEPAHSIGIAVGRLEFEQIVTHLLKYLKRLVPKDPHQLLEFFSRKIVHLLKTQPSVIHPNDMRYPYSDAA